MKNNFLKVAVILLALFISGLFIYGNYGNKNSNRSQQQNTISETPSPAADGTIVIKGFNYGFSPKEITVRQGDTVKIKLTSDDSPHTFTVDELGVNQEFTWGKDITISFVAGKKGVFQFYCAVPGHKENGMVGTLTVN